MNNIATNPEILNESREQMLTALSLFHEHVRHLITILFAAPVAVGAMLTLAKDQPALYSQLSPIASALLIITAPVSIFASLVIWRYYQVYVSALVFAARLHESAGLADLHPWFERTLKQIPAYNNSKFWTCVASKINGRECSTSEKFLIARSLSVSDTFVLYMLLMVSIVAVCLYAAWTIV